VDRNVDMRQSQTVVEEDEDKDDEDGEDNEGDNEDIYDTVIGWTMCAVGLYG
jgi:hypothetical protein